MPSSLVRSIPHGLVPLQHYGRQRSPNGKEWCVPGILGPPVTTCHSHQQLLLWVHQHLIYSSMKSSIVVQLEGNFDIAGQHEGSHGLLPGKLRQKQEKHVVILV
eukprot:4554308-Amphidinium_carterae.1